MRSDYLNREEFEHILYSLTPPNRLALKISLATGLRISDVLSIRTKSLKNKYRRISITEMKTGKHRRLTIPRDLWNEMLEIAGKRYVFEHRTDPKRHRTRQAVWADLKRARRVFRLPKQLVLSPHSARKVKAVEYFHNHSIGELKNLYNHDNAEVTLLYALADTMTSRKFQT